MAVSPRGWLLHWKSLPSWLAPAKKRRSRRLKGGLFVAKLPQEWRRRRRGDAFSELPDGRAHHDAARSAVRPHHGRADAEAVSAAVEGFRRLAIVKHFSVLLFELGDLFFEEFERQDDSIPQSCTTLLSFRNKIETPQRATLSSQFLMNLEDSFRLLAILAAKTAFLAAQQRGVKAAVLQQLDLKHSAEDGIANRRIAAHLVVEPVTRGAQRPSAASPAFRIQQTLNVAEIKLRRQRGFRAGYDQRREQVARIKTPSTS